MKCVCTCGRCAECHRLLDGVILYRVRVCSFRGACHPSTGTDAAVCAWGRAGNDSVLQRYGLPGEPRLCAAGQAAGPPRSIRVTTGGCRAEGRKAGTMVQVLRPLLCLSCMQKQQQALHTCSEALCEFLAPHNRTRAESSALREEARCGFVCWRDTSWHLPANASDQAFICTVRACVRPWVTSPGASERPDGLHALHADQQTISKGG